MRTITKILAATIALLCVTGVAFASNGNAKQKSTVSSKSGSRSATQHSPISSQHSR